MNSSTLTAPVVAGSDRLLGRKVLVTGSSKGIGRGIAIRLAQQDAAPQRPRQAEIADRPNPTQPVGQAERRRRSRGVPGIVGQRLRHRDDVLDRRRADSVLSGTVASRPTDARKPFRSSTMSEYSSGTSGKAPPGPQGARRDNTGSIRPTSNAAGRDASAAECSRNYAAGHLATTAHRNSNEPTPYSFV